MKRLLFQIAAIAFAIAIPLVQHCTATLIITPSGQSDALANRVWYSGGGSYWVDNESSTALGVNRDTTGSGGSDRWWCVPVFEFPLAGVSANSATLNLHVSAAGGGPLRVRYAGGDNNGVVEAGDWLNVGIGLGTFDGSETGWHSYNITTQLADCITAGNNWIVFTVGSDDQYANATISASESVTFSPFIEVVPEPSTLVLLGMGAAGLLAYAKRRRAT